MISKGTLKDINIPEKSVELAEFVGILLGDGNIHSYVKGKKIRTYMVRIAGDCNKDREYHVKYISGLCRRLFNIKPKIYNCPNKNEMFTLMHSRLVVEFLTENAFSPGNKKKNKVDIPGWIKENPDILRHV